MRVFLKSKQIQFFMKPDKQNKKKSTLPLNSISGLLSVCYKTTLITGSIGSGRTSELRTLFMTFDYKCADI